MGSLRLEGDGPMLIAIVAGTPLYIGAMAAAGILIGRRLKRLASDAAREENPLHNS